MREEIIELLINSDTETLCNTFGLLPFQVHMLEFYYKNIPSMASRSRLVEQISEKHYSDDSIKQSMARSYIDKAIKFAKDHGKNLLVNKCGLTEEESISFINDYLRSDREINEMLSAELDVSNNNKLLIAMVDKVIPTFIQSQTPEKGAVRKLTT